ncbi:sensor histidine kinase [uncultured Amnibacterium sp.]|uniref:sensor histidine kinase n=1 Tax=uncultured Amnibacterium sp. TaxID=1631851 RepID=UPI0035CC68BC
MPRIGPRFWLAFDVLLGCAMIAVAEIEIATGATYEHVPVWPGPRAVTSVAVVVLIAPVVLRRVRPRLALALLSALLASVLLLLGDVQSGVAFVLLVVILYSGAAHIRRAWPSLTAAAVLVVVVGTRPGAITGVGDLVFFAGLTALAIVLGRAVRLRHEQIDRLTRQEQELRRLHAAEVAAATAAERAAIAGELHDIVAHAISIVVIEAQVGRRMLPDEPGRASEALRTIESSGRAALTELRRLLTVLDGGEQADATAPTPSVANLADVVDRLRAVGLAVDVGQDELPPLPAATELAIHRTVQEALTNSLKHAPGKPVRVRIRRDDEHGQVEVTVQNAAGDQAGAVPGSARGLIGMRERLRLVGGTLTTGPQGAEFVVRATVPLDAVPHHAGPLDGAAVRVHG